MRVSKKFFGGGSLAAVAADSMLTIPRQKSTGGKEEERAHVFMEDGTPNYYAISMIY